MDYAYLDSYGILHIVDERYIAEEFASGNIVETEIPNSYGYPVTDDAKYIVVYTKESKVKVGGTVHPYTELKKYPAVDALVKELTV